MEKTGIFAVLLTLIVSLGINTAGAQEQGQAKNKDKNDALAPIIILGPPIIALDKELAGGCWARLYHSENYMAMCFYWQGRLTSSMRVRDFRLGP